MRIVYIANFEAGGNEDENAICYALRELGHEVQPLREKIGFQATKFTDWAQLVLFHKFDNVDVLREYKGKCPRVFWWFDLVDYPQDPTLAGRCQARVDWMNRITPHVDYGFLSDGDWVAQDKTGKLYWLCQGADERIVGRGRPLCESCGRGTPPFDILFTGIDKGGGVQRESFVKDMRERYGERFKQVARGVHREELRDLIASAKIVVCPDSPVTNNYWSNRVWNAMGFGAFVLHRFCYRLPKFYDGRAITFYQDRDSLYELIDHYTDDSTLAARQQVSEQALQQTIAKNLYRHRCEELVKVVQRR